MTKNEIADQIAEKLKMDRRIVKRVIQATFDTILDVLEKEHRFELRWFGTFEVRGYEGRMAINPGTKKPKWIGPKNKIKLCAGKPMEDMLKRMNAEETIKFWAKIRKKTKVNYQRKLDQFAPSDTKLTEVKEEGVQTIIVSETLIDAKNSKKKKTNSENDEEEEQNDE